jgi:hypothetical protein
MAAIGLDFSPEFDRTQVSRNLTQWLVDGEYEKFTGCQKFVRLTQYVTKHFHATTLPRRCESFPRYHAVGACSLVCGSDGVSFAWIVWTVH